MSDAKPVVKRGLVQRLAEDWVLCAEGYLFELERRGRLQAGSFVPEVALDNPEALLMLHKDFVDAGSEVVVAFTYNAHREKLRIIGKEDRLEPLNRAALNIAKLASEEASGEKPLVAGNISNTNLYDPADPASEKTVRAMFAELTGWAAQAGVDYMIGETFYHQREAQIALEVIKEHGLPAVITLGVFASGRMADGPEVADTCAALEEGGAAAVGLNCFRGPATMLPLIQQIRRRVGCPVAALPVPYRTTQAEPTFFHLSDPGYPLQKQPYETTFPVALDPLRCNRYEIADFARQAHDMGVTYLGVCCGAAPVDIRAMAEALGRRPPASRYSPDMTRQFLFGDDPTLSKATINLKDQA